MTIVVAIDFGATSIRVARVRIGAGRPLVNVVHRAAHHPVPLADGSLRWDWDRLVGEAIEGLEMACARGPVASIGIDTWGVDYGLIDDRGRLLSPPHSYRSTRTSGYDELLHTVGARRAYAIAGTQVQPFTTIFQLAAHDPVELRAARHILLLPDLLTHYLTGAIGAERTNAGTTGLLDLATRTWSPFLTDAVGVHAEQLPPVVEPGTTAGTWRGIPVHRVGSHDTASAVVATPLVATSQAFVATGTWLLVGDERDQPDRSPEAEAANFGNEQSVDGGIRFLRNVAGFWLLERCRATWGLSMSEVLDVMASVPAESVADHVFDATDARFHSPDDMVAEIVGAAGIDEAADPAVIGRVVIESLAATTATILDRLGGADHVHLIGGGAGIVPMHDALGRWTGANVHIGPTEAAVVGNALVQGVAIGVFDSLREARASLGTVGPTDSAAARTWPSHRTARH